MYTRRLLLIPILTIVMSGPTGTTLQAQYHKVHKKLTERFTREDPSHPLRYQAAMARPISQVGATFGSLPGHWTLSSGDFRTDMIRPLPGQEPGKTYKYPAVLALGGEELLVAYMEHGWDYATLWVAKSSDSGTTWNKPQEIATGERTSYHSLNLTRTPSGRVLLSDESPYSANHLFYSDDEGSSWTPGEIDDLVQPQAEDWPFGRSTPCGEPEPWWWVPPDAPSNNVEPIIGPVGEDMWHVYSDLSDGSIKYFVSKDGLSWSEDAVTMLVNPDATSFLYLRDIVQTGVDSFLAAFKKLHIDTPGCTASTVLSRSVDGGETWSTPELLRIPGMPSDLSDMGRLKKSPDGRLWYMFQDRLFNWGVGRIGPYPFPTPDIHYMTSEDNGISWSRSTRFTFFAGTDSQPDYAFAENSPLVAFSSTRFMHGEFINHGTYGYPDHGRIWIGSPGSGGEYAEVMPPIVSFDRPFRFTLSASEEVEIRAVARDESDLSRVWAVHSTPDGEQRIVDLEKKDSTDEGELWTGGIGSLPLGDVVDLTLWAEDADGLSARTDRIRYDFGSLYKDLVPARYFVLPRHEVGRVCTDLTSAVKPTDYPPWLIGAEPRSGGVGPWPMNLPALGTGGTAAMRWPCPGGHNYLFDAEFFLGIKTIDGRTDPRSIIQWDVTWTEVEKPVESTGWSDQDYRLKYEDSDGLGALVTQRSHQFSSGDAADMIFFEYTIENTGVTGGFGDLVAALYMDPEIGILSHGYAFDDYVAFDQRESVLYGFDSGTQCVERGKKCLEGHVAIVLLTDQEIELVSLRHWYDYSDTDLWDDGISPDLVAGDPAGPGDVTGALGVGIESLDVGETVTVAFALIMADSPEDLLLTKVPLARSIYKDRSRIPSEPPPAARIVSPSPYTELWAGTQDSLGVEPGAVLDASFVWETIGKSEEDGLSYALQLSAEARFTTLIQRDAGNANRLDSPFLQAEVADFLAEAGVELFESDILYTRVVSSNEETMTYGPHLPLVVRRGVITAVEGEELPHRYALHANYPNPFNPATTIRFDLPVSGEVSLTVFDVLGREVSRLADGLHAAGRHAYQWNASNVASGMYVYRLKAGEYVASRTLVLTK